MMLGKVGKRLAIFSGFILKKNNYGQKANIQATYLRILKLV
jgi:hypothetical protein